MAIGLCGRRVFVGGSGKIAHRVCTRSCCADCKAHDSMGFYALRHAGDPCGNVFR